MEKTKSEGIDQFSEGEDKRSAGQPQPAPAIAPAAGQPAGQSSVKSPSWLAVAAMSVLISVAASVGSVYVYDHFYAQKVVSVDLKGFIAEQRDLYLKGKINDAQFKANVDKMAAIVKAIPKNRVAIMGDAVVRNAEIVKLP